MIIPVQVYRPVEMRVTKKVQELLPWHTFIVSFFLGLYCSILGHNELSIFTKYTIQIEFWLPKLLGDVYSTFIVNKEEYAIKLICSILAPK